jgi:hypothetical protein
VVTVVGSIPIEKVTEVGLDSVIETEVAESAGDVDETVGDTVVNPVEVSY